LIRSKLLNLVRLNSDSVVAKNFLIESKVNCELSSVGKAETPLFGCTNYNVAEIARVSGDADVI
jgi:hypothetical protein